MKQDFKKMATALRVLSADMVEQAQALVEAANERGGRDNISVVLIKPDVKEAANQK